MQKTLNKNEIVLERAKNFNFKVAFHVCATTKKYPFITDYELCIKPFLVIKFLQIFIYFIKEPPNYIKC